MRLSEEELVQMLTDERPEVDPGFADELDRWAAAGFPRAERPRGRPAPLADVRARFDLERIRAKLRAIPPRRLVAPAGAALTLVVVAGIAVSQSGGPGGGNGPAGFQALPEEAQDAPSVAEPARPLDGGTDSGQAAAEGAARDAVGPTSRGLGEGAPPSRPRRVAQNVDLVLASEPEDVREVADGVNDVVNRYRGFVVTSSVQSGDERAGLGAQFQLRIPVRSLQAALAELSELAHVQSRTEGLRDITQRFISAQERIGENETARATLLRRLEDATTEAEIDAIRAQLRTVNAALEAARRDLAAARQRVQLVPVSVSIVTEAGVDNDSEWGVDDAVDDAVDVLETIAGIAIVAVAVLLPLALIGLVIGFGYRIQRDRARERALDE